MPSLRTINMNILCEEEGQAWYNLPLAQERWGESVIRRPINGFEADKLTRRTRLYAMDRFLVIFIFKSSGVVESKLVGVHIDILYCFFAARVFFVAMLFKFCCQVRWEKGWVECETCLDSKKRLHQLVWPVQTYLLQILFMWYFPNVYLVWP